MSRAATAKIDRFTPVPDSLVTKFGLVTAAVYGRIWRYSQASRGVCDASQQKIADDLSLDRVTVNLHIKKLVDGGYLKDKTPTVTNRPHTYAVTDRLQIEMTVTVVENNTGVVQDNSSVVENNSGGVVENNSKIQDKIQSKKQTGAKEPRPRDEMFDAVVEVCQSNAKLEGSAIAKVANEIKAAGFTVADVRAFGKDWWAWKERIKPPSPWKLKSTISQVRAKAPTGRGPMLPEGLLDD